MNFIPRCMTLSRVTVPWSGVRLELHVLHPRVLSLIVRCSSSQSMAHKPEASHLQLSHMARPVREMRQSRRLNRTEGGPSSIYCASESLQLGNSFVFQVVR